MNTRTLGKNGPKVSALGPGCMGMSEFYETQDDAESVANPLLRTAMERANRCYGCACQER
jgi:aryl-alcohol dehydrogenase-like predicted oxidoreductase